MVSTIARDKGITIRNELRAGVELVTLDRQRLIQVLYNLLSNAVKFTDNGGEVFISAEAHGQSSLCLRIRDTGIGISPENIGNLFIEFRQLDAGPTRRYAGTGLGLALTKKIVEAQLGTVSVESKPGQGSVFTVILPIAGRSRDNRSVGRVDAALKPRVLIVDDNPINLRLATDVLEAAEYRHYSGGGCRTGSKATARGHSRPHPDGYSAAGNGRSDVHTKAQSRHAPAPGAHRCADSLRYEGR